MKRIILKVLVAMVCLTITGCGSSIDPNSSMNEFTATYTDESTTMADNTYSEGSNLPEGISDEQLEEQMTVEEIITDETKTVEPEVIVELKGIIIVQADWRDQSVLSYTVFTVDPDINTSQELSQFTFTSVNQYNADTIQPAWKFGRYANLYDHFSSDYTKMAATKTLSSNGETHAGWLDTAGNFYDVTVALGEQSQSDFDEPSAYHAVGFQDNTFIYVCSDDKHEEQYYGISVDNVTPGVSWEIDSADNLVFADWQGSWNWMLGYKPTDWLDNDHVLVETAQSKCRIATVSTQTLEEYLPGESTHSNWSAVASPDGTKVAFISRPSNGEEINMYVSSISGENPVKLEPDFMPIFYPQAADKVSSGMACCYILEWR